MTRQLTLLTSLIAGLWAAGAAQAQIGRGDAPIRITAKTSEYLQNEGRAIWTGDVVAVQADSKMNSDKLTAICIKPKATTQGGSQSCEEIEKLVADGNVLYTAPDAKIRCDHAEYDYAASVITMTGNCVSARGTEEFVMQATKVVYDLNAGRVTATAGDQRVLAILTPTKKNSAAQPAPPATTPAPVPAPAATPN